MFDERNPLKDADYWVMTRAIYYLTFNGVYNLNNGIGTQTRTFLQGLTREWPAIVRRYGATQVHVVAPAYHPASTPDYSEALLSETKSLVRGLGGSVHLLRSQERTGFWNRATWEALSRRAARMLAHTSRSHGESLIVAIDAPFLRVPLYLGQMKDVHRVQSVVVAYSSSYLHDRGALSTERLEWEYGAFAAARRYDSVRLADVCRFMTSHLVEHYGAPAGSFVPFRSSLCLAGEDFAPMSRGQIASVLARYRIPLRGDVVLAFGRAAWIKGFDVLIEAARKVRRPLHLVLVAVPQADSPNVVTEYARALRRSAHSYTLVRGFTRDLPRALAQWPGCRVVVCPSRGEPFSNIPLEVAVWAQNGGPVCLCSDIDGFREQIREGWNGYLFEAGNADQLASALTKILQLPEEVRARVRTRAAARVRRQHDFARNIHATLAALWGGSAQNGARTPRSSRGNTSR